MSSSKIIVAGLLGGVLAFLLGFLFYGVLLMDFFESNTGSATGVWRASEEMQWIPMVLGHLTWGLFFAVIFGRWANISTFVTGAKAGAVLGFLIAFTFDMIELGSTHLSTWTSAMVNIVTMVVISAIVGAFVAWWLGRAK